MARATQQGTHPTPTRLLIACPTSPTQLNTMSLRVGNLVSSFFQGLQGREECVIWKTFLCSRPPPWIPIHTLGSLLCKSKGPHEKAQDPVDSLIFPPQRCQEQKAVGSQMVPLQSHLFLSLLPFFKDNDMKLFFSSCLIMPGKFLLFRLAFMIVFNFLFLTLAVGERF